MSGALCSFLQLESQELVFVAVALLSLFDVHAILSLTLLSEVIPLYFFASNEWKEEKKEVCNADLWCIDLVCGRAGACNACVMEREKYVL